MLEVAVSESRAMIAKLSVSSFDTDDALEHSARSHDSTVQI